MLAKGGHLDNEGDTASSTVRTPLAFALGSMDEGAFQKWRGEDLDGLALYGQDLELRNVSQEHGELLEADISLSAKIGGVNTHA